MTTLSEPRTHLSYAEWSQRAAKHQERLAPKVLPHMARRETHIKHPVHDFMFVYYSWRPAQLMAWNPGTSITWEDAGGSRCHVDLPLTQERINLVDSTLNLLRATSTRAANFGCFGLHEWAMVYHTSPDQIRHLDHRLRLGHAGTDEFVESQRILCTHFDAFRFFTPPARSLNLISPGRDDRVAFEQSGCLHANMDLYKHAFRLAPLVPSDLIADCFELAWDIRITDMRAAPYDLSGLVLDPDGEAWTPLLIETPQGRVEYATTQRAFAERAAPLRAQLIGVLEAIVAEVA